MAVRDRHSVVGFLMRRRLVPLTGGLLAGLVLLMAGLALGMARPLPGGTDAAAETSYLRIATGSVSGTNYRLGGALARLVSQPAGSEPCEKGGRCGVAGLSAVAMASDGAVANVQLVAAGLAESALVQADIAANALAGRRPFQRTGPLTDLRAIANLYPEALHLVVASHAGIASVRDLRGKRVSIDRARSGANVDARLVLDYFGVPAGALKLHEVDAAQAAEMLLSGTLDAFFVMGSWPIDIVSDLATRGAARIVPLPEARLMALFENQPFLHAVAIPAGTYAGVGEIETVGTDTVWITRANVPPDFVYALCQALWAGSNRPVIASAHPIAALIDLDAAVRGLPVPLQLGAAKFYGEVGALAPGATGRGVSPGIVVPTPRQRPLRREAQQAMQ
jgi:TRAP transporter TAXI family solute receptor